MPPVGFEPIILVSERLQTHALDRTVTGICFRLSVLKYKQIISTLPTTGVKYRQSLLLSRNKAKLDMI
jgi:hypothetical protein